MDEDIQADWRGVLLSLKILCEATENGRHLTIRHPAYFSPHADMIALTRSAVIGKIDAILAGAVVEREEEKAA